MRFEHLYKLNKDIYIDMQKEIFTGDVLDVGLENYGIIYNLYKLQNKEAAVEYVQGSEEKSYIEEDSYDSCAMLFSLSRVWLKTGRRKLFKDISRFLRKEGVLHLWDIDKSYSNLFKGKIKVLLPENNFKEINLTDINILKDASMKSTVKLLEEYFEIIDLKAYDNVYYIKAKKRFGTAAENNMLQAEMKGSNNHEDRIGSSKFKIRSQQFGSKILEGIHKRFKL